MTRHTAYVRGLAVTPDGKLLISCAQDNTAIVWDLPSGTLRTFLFDPAANTGDAVTYQVIDPVTGQPLVYTLPCGSAILPSATCVCNCVKGTGGGGGGCTFIICVCLAI
jgi:WD40 repeat protein